MKSRAAPLVLALALPACTADLDTGVRSQPIIGGQTASPSEFPTVVALENGPGNWFCTGSLVHEKWVLTAAHCVEGETAGNLEVRFDDANVNDGSGGIAIQIAAIHAHPGFDFDAWDNDIAVLELAEAVTDRAATPVHRTAPAPGTSLTQVGYGDSNDNGGGAGVLRKLVTQNIACAEAGDPGISDANLLCFDASDGTASCYGDSGGPTYVSAGGGLEVTGVTSGGTGNLCAQGYDLHTLVPGELDFVDQYVPVVADDPPPDDDPPGEEDPPGDDDPPGGGGGDNDPPSDDDEPPGGVGFAGCSATAPGGGAGLGLALVGLALALRRRRRR